METASTFYTAIPASVQSVRDITVIWAYGQHCAIAGEWCKPHYTGLAASLFRDGFDAGLRVVEHQERQQETRTA